MTTVEKEQFWTQIVENPSLWGTIQTSDKSFNAQAENIWTVMNETFIKNESLKEVNRWELMLGDRLENSGEGTLNERKARILKRITEYPPVSIKVLKGLIKEITEDNYIFDYDKKENKLTLEFHGDFENDVKDLIPRVIPVISDVVYNYNLPRGYLAAEFLGAIQSDQRAEFPLTWNNETDSIYAAFSTFLAPPESGTRYLRPFGGTHSSGNFDGTYGLHATTYYTATRWYIKVFPPSGGNLPSVDLVNGGVKNEVLLTSNTVLVNGVSQSVEYVEKPTLTSTFQVPGWGCGGAANVNVLAFEHRSSGTANMSLVPAIDTQGKPCLYDKVGKTALYNSGSGEFIVGMTLEQARKLGKLPSTDSGSLTISLPNDYIEDMLITNAIADATSNGWMLTIQTYTPENSASEASTFGMPRIWVRKVQTESGSYVDNENNRYQVEWCVTMYTPDNSTPDQYGYEMFRNVEAACEYWGLSQWIDPEMENIAE